MRIMIIGAQASGKSTFAIKLREKLSIPLVHVDAIVNSAGRGMSAEEHIRSEAEKDHWIMDGNSFTRDKSFRLERADYIFLFRMNRFRSLIVHIHRWQKEKDKSRQIHGRNNGLHLGFALSFALWRWPKREKEIIDDAKRLNKKLIFIHNREEADRTLRDMRLN